mmetsp:Transcript_24046/g.60944  ORF Transcript_24046/g.60944 Transcript_24046/m.60944 type:complete len:347 (-) Transcript_24046:1489-2529(-)
MGNWNLIRMRFWSPLLRCFVGSLFFALPQHSLLHYSNLPKVPNCQWKVMQWKQPTKPSEKLLKTFLLSELSYLRQHVSFGVQKCYIKMVRRVFFSNIVCSSERRPLVRAVAKLSEKRSAVLFKAVVAISPEAKRVLDQLSRLTQQNQVEPAAEVYLLQEDAIVSSIGLEDFDVLCGSFDTFLATGDYLAALRTAAHIRDVYIDEYKGRRFESVVVNTLLPSIASSSINALPPEQAVFVLRDVMGLFPHEAEDVLGAGTRFHELLYEIGSSFTAKGNAEGARAIYRAVGAAPAYFALLSNMSTYGSGVELTELGLPAVTLFPAAQSDPMDPSVAATWASISQLKGSN